MRCILVSHFHWDREWYRTFEAYRARLVYAVDRVLELLDADAGFRFLLDGQTVLLDDYLAVRPGQRAALTRGVRTAGSPSAPGTCNPTRSSPSGEAQCATLWWAGRP